MPLIGSDLVPQTDGNLAELGRVGRFPVTDEAVLIVKDGGPHAEEGRILNHVEVPLFNALNSRPDLASAFDHLFTNKRLWLAIAFGTLAQVAVVELPFLQSAFGTAPLDVIHWVAAFGSGVVLLGYEEVVKAVRRGLAPR